MRSSDWSSDVCSSDLDRRRQLDMAHTLAPDLRQGDLDAALLADDAAVLHALVLAAQALVILDRAEDPGAEQAVALRLEGPVVDGLRLLDLTIRPGADTLRRRARDLDTVEALRPGRLAEDVHQLVHRINPRASAPLRVLGLLPGPLTAPPPHAN